MRSSCFSYRAALIPRLIAIPLILLSLLLLQIAPVAAAPLADPSPSLLISEVYVPVQEVPDAATQWFELYNPTGWSYPLRGLQLATGRIKVLLNTDVVLQPGNASSSDPGSFALIAASGTALQAIYGAQLDGVQIVEAPELFPLDPNGDALQLLTPDGSLVIDSVNWGKPNAGWPNYNTQMWAPGFTVRDATSSVGSWGRTPQWKDTDTLLGGDWTVHSTLSPGRGVGSAVPASLFLGPVTDIAGAFGSLFLWAAFLLIGVLAYRFERLRDTRTYWQILMLAPSGLLFYAIVTIIGFRQNPPLLTDPQRWWAFGVMLVSAIFCLVGMYLFRNVARVLLEGK